MALKADYVDHDIKLAYTAGFIEADGCFQITSSGVGIRVTNNHRKTLERFMEWYGGAITKHGGDNQSNNWNLHGPKAVELARELLPFLMMKQESCRYIIEYGETVGVRGKRITEETRAMRAHIKSRLKESRNYAC